MTVINNSNSQPVSSLIPEFQQTEILKNFLEVTADQLFKKQNVRYASGYIGSKPSYYNQTTDFYLPEENSDRTNYQLSPTVVSYDSLTGQIDNAMFYDDYLQHLKFQGANIENHDRLFNQEYYSWCPPIDVDKILNYQKYSWLIDGPNVIVIESQTDCLNDIFGSNSCTINGSFLFTGSNTTASNSSLTLTSGLRIQFANDVEPKYNNIPFIVEGVGQSIILISDIIPKTYGWNSNPWDSDVGWDPAAEFYNTNYVTIARGSNDGNGWSKRNRWFHHDVIELSQTTVPDISGSSAQRPIIEFQPDIMLYNYGTIDGGFVDILSTEDGTYEKIIKPTPSYVDKIRLKDGMTILFLNETDPSINNKIFKVYYQEITGITNLELVEYPDNINGYPQTGYRISIKYGSKNIGLNLWWNGSSWVEGQQFNDNAIPLFQLFDSTGNQLDDDVIYPSNNFVGNPIFNYLTNNMSPIDPFLGIRPAYDNFGQFQYENSISTAKYTFTIDNIINQYQGTPFYKIGNDFYNSWFAAATLSRQYIVNEFDINSTTASLKIDQKPSSNVDGPPTVIVNVIDNNLEKLMVNGQDYYVSGQNIVFSNALTIGSRVIIKSWSENSKSNISGYYELPLNLTTNPNNGQVGIISKSGFLNQFKTIIQSQNGFVGDALGSNNWRDSPKNRSFGMDILQHRAPMIKCMLLSSTNLIANSSTVSSIFTTQNITDPVNAIQFAQKEYTKFYGRFLRVLFSLYQNGYTLNNSPQDWISATLKQINVGKNNNSAWRNSGYDLSEVRGAYSFEPATNPTFIPPTGARLGITPVFQPMVYIDSVTYQEPKMILQAHDGSRFIMEDLSGSQLGTITNGSSITQYVGDLSNPIARAWLQFELNQFENIPESLLDPDAKLQFDQRRNIPGKFRSTEYSRNEYLDILGPMFDSWVITNQIDYTTNTLDISNVTQATNQFLFNYSNQTDKQGNPLPGYWQGIYYWFYDTDRPQMCPWEMLGFSLKPDWWDDEYGLAPYTSGNSHLWNDLEKGLIRRGSRSGIDLTWARPGLSNCLPVDQQGNLLPPYLAGCVSTIPNLVFAKEEWKFGDGAPAEMVWKHSINQSFVQSLSGYLMKPAQFIEYAWDIMRTEDLNGQWIYIDTWNRRASDDFYVHRENPQLVQNIGEEIPNESDLNYYAALGIQHWISEYIISQGFNVTNIFGNLIRGGNVCLAHRFGGFITTDSLKILVDSFGQVGYSNQIIPDENIHTTLYRSSSIGTFVYSGVIIQKINNGWKILGYDGANQNFTIIPSETNGKLNKVTVGNITVNKFLLGKKTIEEIPYYTVLNSVQEVYDFLISYERYLVSIGWVFDEYDQQSNTVRDWSKAGQDFLMWAQGNWANGNFIALSPLAIKAKFFSEKGIVQFISTLVGNTYPVLDKRGQPITGQSLDVFRSNGLLTVKPLNDQAVYLLKLFATTVEHAIFLDQDTIFNDVIYDPLLNIYQPRIRVYTYIANNWTGRLEAPGFILYQNGPSWDMVANFDKTADDFKLLFNIDTPSVYTDIEKTTGTVNDRTIAQSAVTRTDLSQFSKHNVGYQQRQYLQNLLLEDSTEFEFYLGYIKQKGTLLPITALLRNTHIVPSTESFVKYEQFAFRLGTYGSTDLNKKLSLILNDNEVRNDPQLINFFTGFKTHKLFDDTIEIVPGDVDLISQPDNYETLFSLRDAFGPQPSDLPNAGYLIDSDVIYHVTNSQSLSNLFVYQQSINANVSINDTIWQYYSDINPGWSAYQVRDSEATIESLILSNLTSDNVTIIYNGPNSIEEGNIVTIFGVANAAIPDGTYTAFNVNVESSSFQINYACFNEANVGNIWLYEPIRFQNELERDNNPPYGNWNNGDKAFVDNSIFGGWACYIMSDSNWIPYRTEKYKVDPTLQKECFLFNKNTLRILQYLSYWDPAKGVIPGVAGKQISFISEIDPAIYNNTIDDGMAWGKPQSSKTWWNTKKSIYYDYENGPDHIRYKKWGQLTPGSEVVVYEWVRSPVPPSDWSSYVGSGTDFSNFGLNYAPTGDVFDENKFSSFVEFSKTGQSATWYYFWVTGSITTPLPNWRSMYTKELANIIQNPTAQGIPWYAAISEKGLIVSQIKQFLNGSNSVLDIVYSGKSLYDVPDHKQWQLVSEGDQSSIIDETLINKLQDSLVGYDGLYNLVPDIKLNELNRYGNLVRPRQSWFKNKQKAIETFVNFVNDILSNLTTPLIDTPALSAWKTFFTQEDVAPTNCNYHVSTLTDMYSIQGILSGETVLVDPILATDYNWTVWEYQNNNYVQIKQQTYNTNNYWQYIDWYAEGFTSDYVVDYYVDTLNDRNNLVPFTGAVARVQNIGNNTWAWFIFDGTSWNLVALQDGSVELLSTLYDNNHGFGIEPFGTNAIDNDCHYELENIINGIFFIFTNISQERNDIFFEMINYVLSEQGFVDWVIKTSYLTFKGINIPLTEDQIYESNKVDSLLDFITEVKPYRSKIASFVASYTRIDNIICSISDFDKPLIDGNIVSPVNEESNIILQTKCPNWFNNYQTNPQLIRNFDISLIFDRVTDGPEKSAVISNVIISNSSIATITLQSNAEIFQNNSIIGMGNVISLYDDLNSNNVKVISSNGNTLIAEFSYDVNSAVGSSGFIYYPASDMVRRLIDVYNPHNGQIPLYDPELVNGSTFRGTVLDGGDLAFAEAIPYLSGLSTKEQINNYIDLVIQGGQPPTYQSFIGDGEQTRFTMPFKIQDPANSAVWADGKLLKYGIDYFIPSSLANVEIINSGMGYQVGDLLQTNGAVSNSQFTVSQIGPNGSVQKLTQLTNGYWNVVPLGQLNLEGGNGTNLSIFPEWSGSVVGLIDYVPNKSEVPNIYALFPGQTFVPADTTDELATIYDGNIFGLTSALQSDHPEELVPMDIQESVTVTISTNENGGAGIMATEVFFGNGKERFKLAAVPENTSAIIVFLNGKLLTYGVFNDYLVDFQTGELVFPTAPSGFIQSTIFSTGGIGTVVKSIDIANPGSGFAPGDTIELECVGTPANCSVVSVTAVSANIENAGMNYNIGDIIIATPNNIDNDLVLVVNNVNSSGSISNVIIENAGSYVQLPTTLTTNGSGFGATFNFEWGISTVELTDGGMFKVVPQSYVGISQTSGNGSGATFALTFDSTFKTETYISDGVTDQFTLQSNVQSIDQVYVTLNGVPTDNVVLNGGNLVINTVPITGTVIIINEFQDKIYSQVNNQSIKMVSGQEYYNLTRIPFSTEPGYQSIIVMREGRVLAPPSMNLWKSDGVSTIYTPSAISQNTNVFINDQQMVLDNDYQIQSDTIVLRQPAPVGETIVSVTTDPIIGYEYSIDFVNKVINFPSMSANVAVGWDMTPWDSLYGWDFTKTVSANDIVNIITLSEDSSWVFKTECFDSNVQGIYYLAYTPIKTFSIIVSVSGTIQRPGVDYLLVNQNNQIALKMPKAIGKILVTYATGIESTPASTVKTVINDDKVLSFEMPQNCAYLLSPMYVGAQSINVTDLTLLTMPTDMNPGRVWIENELIEFRQFKKQPTIGYPNSGLLTKLLPGRMLTSRSPEQNNTVMYYNGNGINTLYAAPSGVGDLGEIIFVNNQTMTLGIDYQVVYDPIGVPAGRYYQFKQPPSFGYKNIKISVLMADNTQTGLLHAAGAQVWDAQDLITS